MQRIAWIVVGALGACGNSSSKPRDAKIDTPSDIAIDAALPTLGPDVEVPLLPDPVAAYNHSAEVTIGAHDGRVVIAMIDMHFDSADTFGTTTFSKRVATASSSDRGDHFDVIDPMLGDQTTDPVVRAASDGTFWLTTWDTMNTASGVLARSTDGSTWTTVASPIGFADKQWQAIDVAKQRVYIGAAGGFWSYDFAGTLRAQAGSGSQMASAAVDATGVRFAVLGDTILHWDTTSAPTIIGARLGSGSTPDMYTSTCWSIGMTASGDEWSVRTTKDGDRGAVVLRVRTTTNEGSDRVLSAPDATAVLPAGVLDAQGRLHVVYYETAGAQGRLLYRHSVTADLAGAFTPDVVLDDNAAPGNRWYPFFDSAMGGRRLREYIDIAADGDRVHVAWAHAPIAPSRVHTRWIEPH